MEQLIFTSHDLSKICRLCLTSNVIMTDIHFFSPKLGKQIADKIMECAPIQITEHDQMPTCICQLCNVQLENFHQFQAQVLKSEKTLRQYLQRLHSSEKQTNNLIHGSSEYPKKQNSSTETTVKYESGEIYEKNSSNSMSQMDEEMSVKLEEICHVEIKEELNNDDQFFSPDLYTIYSDGMADTSSNVIEKEKAMVNTGDMKMVPDAKCSGFDVSVDKIEYPGDYGLVTEIPSVSKKSYQCNICKMTFNDSENFEKHKLAHSKMKWYQCDVCEKYFRELGHLKTHKLIHTGEKPHQCEVCKIRFRHLSSFRSHKLKHTGEKPYQCDICRTGFQRLDTLKRHKLIHTGEKPHHCDICNTFFRQINSLNKHKLTHTGEKPFSCDVCKRTFRLSQHLKKHKLIHTGEKPYQCDVCEMCFRSQDSWKGHKLTHTGEKPYSCDICKRAFRLSHHLKKHKLSHTGEKPYQCDICNKCFQQINSLKKHTLTHMGEKPGC